MITENVSDLKIHKLSKEQYIREQEAGNIDPKAIYLTPDETADLTVYATKENVEEHTSDKVSHITSDERNKWNGYESSIDALRAEIEELKSKES